MADNVDSVLSGAWDGAEGVNTTSPLLVLEWGDETDGSGSLDGSSLLPANTLTAAEMQWITITQSDGNDVAANGNATTNGVAIGNSSSETLTFNETTFATGNADTDNWTTIDPATGEQVSGNYFSAWGAGKGGILDSGTVTFEKDGVVTTVNLDPQNRNYDDNLSFGLRYIRLREYDEDGAWTGKFVTVAEPFAYWDENSDYVITQDTIQNGYDIWEQMVEQYGDITSISHEAGVNTAANMTVTSAAGDFNPTSAVATKTTAPCFTKGTVIQTENGNVAIEDILQGDYVRTQFKGNQSVQWIGSTTIKLTDDVHNRPIVFKVGSILGNSEEFSVSPNHRMLVSGHMAEILFGKSEVLIAAKFLVNDKTVCIDFDATEVEYFHMMFDRHEIVFCADGTPTESLFVGKESISFLDEDARNEILEFFPELETRDMGHETSASRVLTSSEAKVMVSLMA